MIRRYLSITLFCLLCAYLPAQAEELSISAGVPLANLLEPLKAGFGKASGVTLRLLYGNVVLVFRQLESGETEVACLGDSFENVIVTLKKEGVTVQDAAAFQSRTIARGAIHTIVNKANPVTRLSREQLHGIFTGRITNWHEVGGHDMPIIVILSRSSPLTNAAYGTQILGNAPYRKDLLELVRTEELRSGVETNPEAIAFGSSIVQGDEVKTIETPDVFRPIILLTKGQPSAKVRKLIDFVSSDQGRKLVQE